mmetsp:Transcript_122075/g.171789  ORF Transcript_122075/g.171789 Transcript_122075/m.171789 type:complete len:270 (-) Transcript_122075:120-929(-)
MHWGSPTADNHQDQRSGRPDGARRPTTARWTGSDWSWCAMRGGRRHGGGQPCQHGNLHQFSSEQWPMRPRQPQRAYQQGYRHLQCTLHGGHWRRHRLHEPGRDLDQLDRRALPGLPGRQRPVQCKHLGHHHGCRRHGPLRRRRACRLCQGRRAEEPQEAGGDQQALHRAHPPALGTVERAEGCHGELEGPSPGVGGQARLQCLGADPVLGGELGADGPTHGRRGGRRFGDVLHARVYAGGMRRVSEREQLSFVSFDQLDVGNGCIQHTA